MGFGEKRLFDVYGIVGLLISIIVTFFTIYSPLKEVIFEYVIIVSFGIGIMIIVLIFLNKFSILNARVDKMGLEFKNIKENLNNACGEICLVDKRFKTMEDLNDIRLDIKDLKRRQNE